jgi:hypothetical protein
VGRLTPNRSATSDVLCSPPAIKMSFLSRVELGFAASQASLGVRDPHAFLGSQPDEGGLEFRDHRQYIEQQPAHRVVGVVHRPAQAEPDMPGGQLVGDGPGIWQSSGQPVQLGHHKGVAVPARRERFPQSRAFPVGAGQAVVDVDAVGRDAQPDQTVSLSGEILLVSGTACIADEKRRHGAPPETGSARHDAPVADSD